MIQAGFRRYASVVLILTVTTATSELYASPGGITGRTLKPGSTAGCGGCHGTQNTGTTISISARSATVATGDTSSVTVTLSGSSGSNSGINIALSRGTGTAVSSNLQASSGELTHTGAQTSPATFRFLYRAPATQGTDTVYATGKGGASSNSWNHATKFVIQVIAPPAAVTLVSPPNGATGVSTTPTMSWNASAGASTYRLQVSTAITFPTTVFDDSTITGITRQVSPPLTNATTYYWRVRAKNAAGSSAWSTPWSFGTSLTSAGGVREIADGFSLHQNYPNPFNPSTRIVFSLPVDSRVTLRLFDSQGKFVQTLVQGRLPAGIHQVIWGADRRSSGVYIARLEATDGSGSVVQSKAIKMLLVK